MFILRVSCRRRGTSFACESEPLSLRNLSYAACRMRASSPSLTVSVSVAAPHAFFASRRVTSSIWSVFFIHPRLPYPYSSISHTPRHLSSLEMINGVTGKWTDGLRFDWYFSDNPTYRELIGNCDSGELQSRRGVRNHRSMAGGEKNDTIVCPLWTSDERRFRSRHYHAWDRACCVCGRKVVVSDAVKREIDAAPTTALVCDQCALMETARVSPESPTQSVLQPEEACAICTRLKEQEEAAAREEWGLHNLKDEQANEAHRKWAHLAEARVRHRRKAHGDERRGKL